jgi:hypothetical protein
VSTVSGPSTPVGGLARSVRKRFRVSSAHPELHKAIYFLCLPPALFAANAAIYYATRGQLSWERLLNGGSYWGADTYAAPWISTVANLAASIVFVSFARSKRVRRSSKIAMTFILTFAWLCTALSFLVIE